MRLRPLRRAAQRLALHGAASQQRALLAVPHPTDDRQLGALCQGRCRPMAHGSLRRGRDPARTHALGPDPAPVRRPVADRGYQDHHHRRRCRQPGRHGGARLSRHPLDGERVLLQRRRRDDVRAPAGGLEAAHRVRRHRRRARRGRGDPARRQVQRRAAERARPRLPVRELRRRPDPARARADRRQLPGQPARLPDPGRGLRGSRRALEADREVGRFAVGDRDRPLAARRGRLARQLRALQVRPPALLAGRPCSVRPCRPVDLHRADLAVRDAGHRQHRLRDLFGSLDGGREHLPPALVPHERHERVHGADLRRLRRQDRRRLRAGRDLAAQHDAAARSRHGRLRRRQQRRAQAAQA